MKLTTILLAIAFTNTVQAEVPSYTCGYGEVEKVATYDAAGSPLKMVPLTLSEKSYLEIEIDNVWNCDEGVEILGTENLVINGKKEVVLSAQCSKDSLGTKKVALTLTCQETYLN